MLGCYSDTMVQTLATDGLLCEQEAENNAKPIPSLIAPVSSWKMHSISAKEAVART